jgi:hypothetical protein
VVQELAKLVCSGHCGFVGRASSMSACEFCCAPAMWRSL